jgi:capsular polysaccharide biosynthesis protein
VNLSSLLKVLWKHKRVVIPMALLSLLACVAEVVVAGPTYRASAAVVLLNPPALPEVTPENPTVPQQYENPYARFGDLSVIVDILVHVLGSEPVGQQLKANGLDGTFEIAANRDFYRGPIIDISAEASSGGQALKNAQVVIDELERQLVELQKSQGTDPSYYIKPNIIVPPNKATTVLSGTLRKLILLAGVGAVLTVASGLLADARQRRRRRVRGSDNGELIQPAEHATVNGSDPLLSQRALEDLTDTPTASARERR